MEKWDACAFPVDEREVLGWECYGGLDLSSSIDITAFVLVFSPSKDMPPPTKRLMELVLEKNIAHGGIPSCGG